VIDDVLFSWNEFTVTIAAWFACVSLAGAADFGPGAYREKKRERKARAQLEKTVLMLAERKNSARKPILFDPDVTYQLRVYKTPARRRHAKI